MDAEQASQQSASAIGIIPARLASERFPRKVLADETGHALIVHVANAAAACNAVSRVVVATDAKEVAGVVREAGFEVVMTSEDHPNGTSRLAEAVRTLGLDPHELVVNVQGDEPEIEPGLIAAVVGALAEDPETGMSTAATPIVDEEFGANPNIVKVVADRAGRALYFTRSLVPYPRSDEGVTPLRHIGLYGYRAWFLERYAGLDPTPLERTERLEQLRVLENGERIRVAVIRGVAAPSGIDTPEQYAAFVARWRERGARIAP